ncbi:isochorismate-pyruvate lyase [Aquimixticola soesokkakensis]|uniref:chorismate mutase n=1 Tax=Aquimixticola soesokkakensis TaxID=1519096 RepID=A0A1Y5S5S0_9RHOB|nr:chorismate mutase [Aquimixticola soesokkakensis]SLN32707.1 isochorismate-pyruvate lyase [Aquimixticola soesokkakensis]
MSPYRPAAQIGSMAELRAEIDRLDRDLVEALTIRQSYIDRAIDLKPAEGIAARSHSRVADVLEKVRAKAESTGFDPELATRLWREMIETSIAREEQTLGTAGDMT